jgi:hypothetical protein
MRGLFWIVGGDCRKPRALFTEGIGKESVKAIRSGTIRDISYITRALVAQLGEGSYAI